MNRRGLIFAVFVALFSSVFFASSLIGVMGDIPPENLRPIATKYLNYTFNSASGLWAAAPEAVAAIVWDYRGLDTFFETTVLFGAIVATIALLYEALTPDESLRGAGLSLISKKSTAIISLFIVSIGVATILHGQLTPGGGFQGGAIAAVAPLLIMVVFSRKFFDNTLLNYRLAVVLRTLGLLGIVITGTAILIVGAIESAQAFVFQNQAKPYSAVSMPSFILDVPMGGTILLFNLFEGLAVFFGFYVVFYAITSSRRKIEEAVQVKENVF